MPNKDMHSLFSKMIFGKYFGKIDKAIDSPAWTPVPHINANGDLVIAPMGPNHRQMFHTPLEAAVIGMLINHENPIEGAIAGLFHVAFDKVFDGLHDVANKQVKKVRKKYKKTKAKRK